MLAETLAALAEPDGLRESTSYGQIPMVYHHERTHYLTFGGSLVNRAIASMTRNDDAVVNDFLVSVTQPIVWNQLPCGPHRYAAFMRGLGPLSDRSLAPRTSSCGVGAALA